MQVTRDAMRRWFRGSDRLAETTRVLERILIDGGHAPATFSISKLRTFLAVGPTTEVGLGNNLPNNYHLLLVAALQFYLGEGATSSMVFPLDDGSVGVRLLPNDVIRTFWAHRTG